MLDAVSRGLIEARLRGGAAWEPDTVEELGPEGYIVLPRGDDVEQPPHPYILDRLEPIPTELPSETDSIEVCAYCIGGRKRVPFLLFAGDASSGSMRWPRVSAEGGMVPTQRRAFRRLVHAFAAGAPACVVRGWENNNKSPVRLWIEVRLAEDDYAGRGLTWCTSWELINSNKCGHVPVDRSFVERFTFDPPLAFLRENSDPSSPPYPLPMVGYAMFSSRKKAEAARALGLPREGTKGPFGDFYGLQRLLLYEDSSPGGSAGSQWALRCAVNSTDVTALMSRETDPDDSSRVSLLKAAQRPLVKATLRGRDCDGRWSHAADTVCRGRMRVSNGKASMSIPARAAVRSQSQIVPLTICRHGSPR